FEKWLIHLIYLFGYQQLMYQTSFHFSSFYSYCRSFLNPNSGYDNNMNDKTAHLAESLKSYKTKR
ncbi:hypothetical protein ACFSPU_13100, partial [Haoranjiania flava]|uniref:hypothetical protein n=1 Tax=Haoranjiania flava TaxID=1856322 RepID=UPI003635DADD